MYLKIQLYILAALASFALESCSGSGLEGRGEYTIMRVNHFQQTGIGEGPYLVYLVQEDGDIGKDRWNFQYDPIEGFEFEPGFVYDLKVRKEAIANPPQDGSSIRYILISLMSKEPVPENENFDIRLKWGGENFVYSEAEEFSLLGQYTIKCNSLCEALAHALEHNEVVVGNFVHAENHSLKLLELN